MTAQTETATQPDVKSLRLFFHPPHRLRLTVGDDRSYPTVRPAWARPQSEPGRHLALLDAKGDEIVLIADPKDLPKSSYEAAMVEAERRYLTARIDKVTHARTEFGATYWQVETHRGSRDFVTQNLQENAQWITDDHLLLVDVDGNRFEIESIRGLDLKSQGLLGAIL